MDPDVDLAVPRQRRELTDYGWRLPAVIAVGGVIGAELRYGTGQLLSARPGSLPLATLLINVAGGFAMGMLMALIARAVRPHPLIRPFLGVGILGGFTTFSTYSTDTYRLLDDGKAAAAVCYLLLTLVGALVATLLGGLAVDALAGRGGAR
jgi:CrcB protein